MDRKNILSESFFDSLKKYFKDRKKYDKLTRILMKDPEWKKAYKKAEKSVDDYHNAMEKALKKRGLK